MSSIQEKLKKFALALVNEDKAEIVIPTYDDSIGFWFGGGNMVEAKDGTLYISGRYRNFGDSRTGLDLGDRGLELAIFESKDKGKSFQKIHSILKSELPQGVLSIEGTSLHFNKDGDIELFISSEKAENSYPEHLKEFLKPGTGVWSIDLIKANSVKELTVDKIQAIVSCTDSQFIHVKDPFYYTSYTGDEYLMFCTHPFNWSSSNTAYMKRKGQDIAFETPIWEFFRRGYTWDVAMTRGTCVFDMPQIGVLKDKRVSLFFYDGGEGLRNMDQHNKAVQRPRGYSCEELGGLAYIENGDPKSVQRISVDMPIFLSPYGTACSRYVNILQTSEGIYATWQQSQKSKAQPLVMNFLSNKEIEELLS